MRLLQPCGKINNDLRNRIQLCVRAKTRVRESQLLEAGKRWEGAPDPAPIWGGGATSRMGGQFSLGSQPRTWDCRLLLSRILGFCSLVFVWHWGATVLDSGTGKMCSLMWLMHDPRGLPWNNTISALLCFYSICRLHLFYVLIHSANTFELFLSISCWAPQWDCHHETSLPLHSLQRKLGWMQPIWPSYIFVCFHVHGYGVLSESPSCTLMPSEFLFRLFSILCNSPNILNHLVVCMSWPFRLEWGHMISSGQWAASVVGVATSEHWPWVPDSLNKSSGEGAVAYPLPGVLSDYSKHNVLLTMCWEWEKIDHWAVS